MQYLSEEMTGTSPGRYEWFEHQSEGFIRRWRSFFGEKIWRLEELEIEDIDRRPLYSEPTESQAAIFARIVWPAAGLASWFLLAAFGFYRKLQRSLIP
jgi:hypothetical protein